MRKKKKYSMEKIPDLKTVKEVVLYGSKNGKDKRQYMFHDDNGVECEKTFNEVYYDYAGLGQYLYSNGVINKHVAILGENTYDWIVCYFALITGTNVTVPLDAKLPDEDLADVLARSDSEILFYAKDFEDSIEVFKNTEGVKVTKYFRFDDIYDLSKLGHAALEKGEQSYLEDTVKPDDLACIVYTSGTTGKSKGVMLTHKNITSNLLAGNSALTGGHAIGFLPLNHSFSWISALFSGCLLTEWGYICRSVRDIQMALTTYKPQNFSAVPLAVETIYKKIMTTAEQTGKLKKLQKGIKISNFLMKLGIDVRRKLFKEIIDNLGGNLEIIPCGGAYLDPVIEKGLYVFGIHVLNGYGITECSPAVTCNRENKYKFGSVGVPFSCNEIKIVEPNENGVGEIYVRGDNVMLGYYKDPDATKEVFDGDWLITGDYGKVDEDGFLYFIGRKKNLIVLSSGKNVSPEEIEDKLSTISYVKEQLVYEEKGVIVAEFYLDTEAVPDAKERIREDVNAVNRTMPVYKHVTKVVTRDTEFPKTTTLKIVRKYNN